MSKKTNKLRVLTGIKPTGEIHLGNFSGAIKPTIELSQNPENEVIFLCPDWHGLTNKGQIFQPGQLSHHVICTYLALGFELENNAIILQSDFSQIQENAWYLACTCSAGLLERSHAYKDALASGKEATAGLLFYPTLMASDIVTFAAHLVPVGKDQAQHLEYASDMVRHFNQATNSQTFLEPKPLFQDNPILLGIDGRKMSKSYQNTISLFGPQKETEKAVKNIKTDSKGLNESKNPEECLIYQLFCSFASLEAKEHMKEQLIKGMGYGYGHAKQDFLQEHQRVFGQKRELYEHYLNNPQEVQKLLKNGYEKCLNYANEVTQKARQALGLKSYKLW